MFKKLSSCLFIFILVLQGCTPVSRLATTPSVLILPTIESFPTRTTTPMPSPTQTKTATQTRTVTATPTITLTPLPSLTFLPTVPNAREELRKLYSTNGGCKLPCWWGITPGETTIDEVKNYFRQFGSEVGFEGQEYYGWAWMYYAPANDSIDYAVSTRLFVNDQIVEAITLEYEAVMWGGFFPARMIAEYGEPEYIYVTSDELSFLVFYYPKKRFLVSYQLSIEGSGENRRACFIAFGSLHTWSADAPSLNHFKPPLYSEKDLLQMDMKAFYKELDANPTSFCLPYEDSK